MSNSNTKAENEYNALKAQRYMDVTTANGECM